MVKCLQIKGCLQQEEKCLQQEPLQQEKLHQSAIIWHGADKGARPPTEQVFFPPEERGEMPQWKRIWRTTTPSGFNREGDTELVAEEGQQPTV